MLVIKQISSLVSRCTLGDHLLWIRKKSNTAAFFAARASTANFEAPLPGAGRSDLLLMVKVCWTQLAWREQLLKDSVSVRFRDLHSPSGMTAIGA